MWSFFSHQLHPFLRQLKRIFVLNVEWLYWKWCCVSFEYFTLSLNFKIEICVSYIPFVYTLTEQVALDWRTSWCMLNWLYIHGCYMLIFICLCWRMSFYFYWLTFGSSLSGLCLKHENGCCTKQPRHGGGKFGDWHGYVFF